jgi:hypothetical protein
VRADVVLIDRHPVNAVARNAGGDSMTLSEAPVSISGITGAPGHISAATLSSGFRISGLGITGGKAFVSGGGRHLAVELT